MVVIIILFYFNLSHGSGWWVVVIGLVMLMELAGVVGPVFG